MTGYTHYPVAQMVPKNPHTETRSPLTPRHTPTAPRTRYTRSPYTHASPRTQTAKVTQALMPQRVSVAHSPRVPTTAFSQSPSKVPYALTLHPTPYARPCALYCELLTMVTMSTTPIMRTSAGRGACLAPYSLPAWMRKSQSSRRTLTQDHYNTTREQPYRCMSHAMISVH